MRELAVTVRDMCATAESGGVALEASLELRGRTHGLRLGSESCSMTVPRASNDLLMCLPSASRSTFDAAFSLPARSIRDWSAGR